MVTAPRPEQPGFARRALRRILDTLTRAPRPRGITRAGVSTSGPSRSLRIDYQPRPDGNADPGEIVWTWVPFEEDPGRGKDRPVVVVAKDGDRLTALMLTSKDHDRDAADEARHGRQWLDIGSGAWDERRRPSEVRLDRVLTLSAAQVRREGALLPRPVFDRIIAAAAPLHGWRRGRG